MDRSRNEPAPAALPRRSPGPLAAALAALATAALLAGAASGQGPGAADPVAAAGHASYGQVEVGAYAPLDGYDPSAADAPHGALAVSVAVPTDQAPDVTVTGPDGFVRTEEIDGEGALDGLAIGVVKSGRFEGLPPGVYVVAATDDGLDPAAGRVEVRAGEVAALAMTLQEIGGTLPGIASASELGSIRAARYDPVEGADDGTGAIRIVPTVLGPDGAERDATDVGLRGAIVGPDDERVAIEGGTSFGGLPEGVYSVALTAEGFEVAEVTLEIRAGREVVVEATLRPADVVAAGGAAAGGDDAEDENPLEEEIGGEE